MSLESSPEVQLLACARRAGATGRILRSFERLAAETARVRAAWGAAAAADVFRVGAKSIALGIEGGLHGVGRVVPIADQVRAMLNACVAACREALGEDGQDVSHQVLVDRAGCATVRSSERVPTSAGEVLIEGVCTFQLPSAAAARPLTED